MTSFGKIAQQAAARLAKLRKGDDGTMANAGAVAPSVTRAPAPRPPQGSTLGGDAKNIKIRQRYEDIPEAGMQRRSIKKSSKKSSF